MPKSSRAYLYWINAWLPALLGVCVIIIESTATFSAEHTGHWLSPLWLKMMGPGHDAGLAELNHILRKTGHFLGYGTLSLLIYRGWVKTLARKGFEVAWVVRLRAAAAALAILVVVAAGDEFHQSFLPSRTGTPVDVGLDFCGALAAHLLMFGVMYASERREAKKDGGRRVYSVS